jgi:hypothetical protein
LLAGAQAQIEIRITPTPHAPPLNPAKAKFLSLRRKAASHIKSI